MSLSVSTNTSISSESQSDIRSRFIRRTLWTSATFITANTFAVMMFTGQSLPNRYAFSLIQSGAFNYFFESRTIQKHVEGIKKYFDHPQVHHIIEYAFFFFLAMAPVVSARVITTWLFQPLSLKEGFEVGGFNYLSALVGMYLHEKVYKEE